MGCCLLENGQSSHAALWRLEANVTTGALSLTWTAPTWVHMLQITANWSAVPLTSENLTLIKDHAGAAFDVTFRNADPSVGALNIQNWVCVEHFVWEPGEIVQIDYPNSDNNNVGVEIYFQQIDK